MERIPIQSQGGRCLTQATHRRAIPFATGLADVVCGNRPGIRRAVDSAAGGTAAAGRQAYTWTAARKSVSRPAASVRTGQSLPVQVHDLGRAQGDGKLLEPESGGRVSTAAVARQPGIAAGAEDAGMGAVRI